ncbi:MAG TPA: OsmC family protein [Rhizomicrobium sp.]|nr:OsmC family protein [Rhizomicrobium sp.]
MSNINETETITVSETGLGKYQVEARMGASALLIDEPVSAGGLGSGPNPYDLLAAALGACTTMTIRLYANRKGWPLSHVETAVRHSRAGLNARDHFELDIALEGELDAGQRARILEIAERCPVHLTLMRGSEVAAKLMPASQARAVHPSDGTAHMECMREACAD